MNPARRSPALTPGRAAYLSLAYFVVGVLFLTTSIFGGWVGIGLLTFIGITFAFQVHVSRRPWSELGFSLHLPDLLKGVAGLALGAGLFALVAGILHRTGSVAFGPGDLTENWAETAIFLAAFALIEELFFRGYPLLLFARALGPYRAILITSAAFALLHSVNPSYGVSPFAGVFLAGCVMGAVFLRWRSLWAAWGLHYAWNAAQGLLFGFPISGISDQDIPIPSLWEARVQGPGWWTGGGFGPEGSLPALLVLAGAAWLLAFMPGAPSLEDIQERREKAIQPEPRGPVEERKEPLPNGTDASEKGPAS